MRRLPVSVPSILAAAVALAAVAATSEHVTGYPVDGCTSDAEASRVASLLADSAAQSYQLPPTWRFQTTGSRLHRGQRVTRFELLADERRVEGTGLVVALASDCSADVRAVGVAKMRVLAATDLTSREISDPRSLVVLASRVGNASTVRHLYSSIEVTSEEVYFLEYFATDREVVAIDAERLLVHRSDDSAGHGSWLPQPLDVRRDTGIGVSIPHQTSTSTDASTFDRPVLFTTGSGNAYSTDPSVARPEVVAIPRLKGDGNRLDGKFVRVSSTRFDNGMATPSVESDASYVFEPITDDAAECYADANDCTLFDNVNAYVHIDRFAQEFWTERLGFEIDFQTTVLTHSLSERSTVHGDTINIGWGGLFLRNNAYEDELLYHEYAHSVMRQLGFELNLASPIEMRSVNEGYADYFALTYVDQPIFANWATKCPPRNACPGPDDDTEIRTLATDPAVWNWSVDLSDETLKYGICTRWHSGDGKCKTSWATWEPIYIGAMIWGSALWDVRTALGRDLADELVFNSLIVSGGILPTPNVAAGAIMRADEQLNGGDNLAALRELFLARGIASSFSPVSIDASPELPENSALQLSAYPSPFRESVTIAFELATPTQVWAYVIDLAGRTKHRVRLDGAAGQNTHTIDLRDLASGFYVLALETEGETASTLLVHRR